MNFIVYLLKCIAAAILEGTFGETDYAIGYTVLIIGVLVFTAAGSGFYLTRLSPRAVILYSILVLIAVIIVFCVVCIIVEQGIMGIPFSGF